jgi:hypothetical protein
MRLATIVRTLLQRALLACRSRRLLLYELQFHPAFWQTRERVRQRVFDLRKYRSRRRTSARGARDAVYIFADLFSIIMWRVVAAITIVVLFAVIAKLGDKWLSVVLPVDANAATNFLGTLGQVSAAFLALYFTALSVVVGTAYARVPGDIRRLIMQEQVGSFYFKTLALFGAVVAIMFTAVVYEIPIGSLNIMFAAGLCVFSVFCFVVLGIRLFDYFDPAALLPLVTSKLQDAISLVAAGQQHWRDESFQAHHSGEARRLLNNYEDLITLSGDAKNTNRTALREIGKHVVLTLRFYTVRKSRIPSSSYWFARTYKHKDWLTTSYNEVGIALATGTSIQPEEVPNHLWFEQHVGGSLGRIFEKLNRFAAYSTTVSLGLQLHSAVHEMGRAFGSDEALLLIHSVKKTIEKQYEMVSKMDAKQIRESEQKLAVLDVYTSLPINLVLGLLAGFTELTVDRLEGIVRKTNSSRKREIYTGEAIPRPVVEKLEFVYDAVRFERSVFGYPLSPIWFRQEACAHALVNFLNTTVRRILDEFEELFADFADALLMAKRFTPSALVAQKGLEACTKLNTAFEKLEERHQAYAALDRSKEYVWPQIDWMELNNKVSSLKDRLTVLLASCLGELAKEDSAGELPDFFGEAYSFVADACFDSALRGNEKLFNQLFPPFFAAAFQAFDRMRQRSGNDTRSLMNAIQPLADLAAVSGYALVLSEVFGNNISQTVTTSWDLYFTQRPSDEARQQLIMLLSLVVEPTLHFSTRDMLRTRWKQACRSFLSSKGLLSGWSGGRRARRTVSHDSPLVRTFASRFDMLTDGEDVFLAMYAFARPDAAAIKKPRRIESFQVAFQRESQKDGAAQAADAKTKI